MPNTNDLKYGAYEGANGWYVARERADGFHHQPSEGPWMAKAEAEAEARAKTRGRGYTGR